MPPKRPAKPRLHMHTTAENSLVIDTYNGDVGHKQCVVARLLQVGNGHLVLQHVLQPNQTTSVRAGNTVRGERRLPARVAQIRVGRGSITQSARCSRLVYIVCCARLSLCFSSATHARERRCRKTEERARTTDDIHQPRAPRRSSPHAPLVVVTRDRFRALEGPRRRVADRNLPPDESSLFKERRHAGTLADQSQSLNRNIPHTSTNHNGRKGSSYQGDGELVDKEIAVKRVLLVSGEVELKCLYRLHADATRGVDAPHIPVPHAPFLPSVP
eukprot:3738188-Pyramimonas_sp.AAC.2